MSRIAIFPLVSVTTSFVAEEDAACKMASEEFECEEHEGPFSVNSEMKELIPQNGMWIWNFYIL